MYANELFPDERQTTDGMEYGFSRSELCRAVEIWFHANGNRGRDVPLTVGIAAAAFNVSAEFLAEALDEKGSFYFYAREGEFAADRQLDCDGE